MTKKEISLLAFVVTVVVIIVAILNGDAEARGSGYHNRQSELKSIRLGADCTPIGQWVYKCVYPDAKCYVVVGRSGVAMDCAWVESE
jgi:hypothetical protein